MRLQSQFSVLILFIFTIIAFSGCSTISSIINTTKDAYDATLGKAVEAESMLTEEEELVESKKYTEALALLDQVIQKHSSTLTLDAGGVTTYGHLAEIEKTRIECLKSKANAPKFTTRSSLRSALVQALNTVSDSSLDKIFGCGIGVATPTTDHEIVYNTLKLAQEINAQRKNQGTVIPLTATGDALVLTEGFADGKVRRFALVYDKFTSEWYIESVLQGDKAEVTAVPAFLQAFTPPQLTPAEQQQLRQDFAEYMDPDGLISSDKNPGINTTGNGLLYTSYYYLLLNMYGILTDADKQKFIATVQACRKDGIDGLYNRTPTKTDQEGPDDYIGITTASADRHISAPMSEDIYNYGEDNYVGPINWVFNNENPGQFSFSAWLGRFPQFLTLVQMTSGHKPPAWRRTAWAITVSVSGTSNPDGNQAIVLNWLYCDGLDPRFRAMKLVAKDWKRKVLKNYANGMKDVFSVYFNNPNHPLSKWALTNFDWE